jgi:hypothetical protein
MHITVSPAGNATIQDVMERVDATGGNISETVIETLEPIDTKYPVPSAGESTKVFMGKVTKYIEDTKPLKADMFVYVATTGSNTTGDGTSSKPYKTITYALSTIPKAMNGFNASITISGGAYDEDVIVSGFDGRIQLLFSENIAITGLTVNNSTVTCNSTGTVVLVTCGSLFIRDNATLNSFISVNWNITSYIDYLTRRMSIIVDYESNLTASGIFELSGNDGIAIFCVNNSHTSFGTVRGVGFDVGFYTYRNGQIMYELNNLSATKMYEHRTGGVIIKSSGAIIGTLQNDVTLYVATTGSDTTGNGSNASPYRTIQYAIDSLPKDLGGYFANIIIADGIYDEDVIIYGYASGVLTIMSTTPNTLNSNCKVGSISVKDSTYTQLKGITVTRTDKEGMVAWNSVLRVFYCQSTVTKPSSAMCYLGESVCDFTGCKCINANTIVLGQNSRISSLSWTSDSTAVTPFFLYGGNVVSETGTQPLGKNFIKGSQIFHENGTQISNIISSGLSCTWGILRGGYIRQGNLNGVAMVTIQTNITLGSNLSTNSQYTINGFPIPSITDTAVMINVPANVRYCYISQTGSIVLELTKAFAVGDIFVFNCTYLTNS